MVLKGSLSLEMWNSTKIQLKTWISVKNCSNLGLSTISTKSSHLVGTGHGKTYRICKHYVGFQPRAGDMVGNQQIYDF